MFQEAVNNTYSLSNYAQLKAQVKADQENAHQRLQQRKETLQMQMERGSNIIENPVQFLRQQAGLA